MVEMQEKHEAVLVGVDVGSTTTKIAAFDAGEGVLIPAEILHHAEEGCRTFVILQPFGCLPNHVVGRGISKRLKELYPDAQILPLDYDPDVSFANVENRLQMLIMNQKDATHSGQNSHPHDRSA